MQERLLILGASARSAAHSAIRAGFAPVAADLFADVDLTSVCATTKVASYPNDLELAANQMSSCPWIYTGALENYPQVIERIAHSKTLLGNSNQIVTQVRDPWKLTAAFSTHKIVVPKLRTQHDPPTQCEWLIKAVKSSGGLKIRHHRFSAAHDGDAPHDEVITADSAEEIVYQEYISGISGSAVFIGTNQQSVLLGVTQQLRDFDWLGAPGFAYCGSLGPWRLSHNIAKQVEEIGACVAQSFDLVGLFGVDFVIRDEQVLPLEVNPRYTASVEVIERAYSICALRLHADACRHGQLPPNRPVVAGKNMVGKAIKYANSELLITTAAVDFALVRNHNLPWPSYADIPQPGTVIGTGKPIMSLFATGTSIDEIDRKLQELWSQFELRLE